VEKFCGAHNVTLSLTEANQFNFDRPIFDTTKIDTVIFLYDRPYRTRLLMDGQTINVQVRVLPGQSCVHVMAATNQPLLSAMIYGHYTTPMSKASRIFQVVTKSMSKVPSPTCCFHMPYKKLRIPVRRPHVRCHWLV
jgi:hypothetical protein